MDSAFLVKLTSRRWSFAILSALHGGTAGRQAALISATGASRASFLDSLAHLQALGLVARNSGHGHPLRPEYIISDKGKRWAALAQSVMGLMETDLELKTAQRAWALPVLMSTRRPIFFGELKSRLDPVTDRALSEVLKGLNAAHWVSREIETAARPPRPRYQAIRKGAQIAEILGAGAGDLALRL